MLQLQREASRGPIHKAKAITLLDSREFQKLWPRMCGEEHRVRAGRKGEKAEADIHVIQTEN